MARLREMSMRESVVLIWDLGAMYDMYLSKREKRGGNGEGLGEERRGEGEGEGEERRTEVEGW